MSERLKQLHERPAFKIEEGHVVEFAFNDGVEDYYVLTDIFNTFCRRAFSAFHIYQEWNQRTTNEMLLQFCKRFEDIINDKEGISLTAIIDTVNKLKERLVFPIPTEKIIYKMATVVYFDRHESPYLYDQVYGNKKMERWMNNPDIADFFLQTHLSKLIPSPNISEQDFNLCQMVMKEIEALYQLPNPSLA